MIYFRDIRERIKVYWRQVKHLTLANMKARYRKTLAGILWVVLNPIIMYSVQSFVFKRFLKVEVDNYSLFLLGGLLPWIFIVTTLDMCTPLLRSSNELLKAFKIDPRVIVISQLFDNLFNFLIAFFAILVPFWIFYQHSLMGIFFLPLALLQMIVGLWGMTWFLSVFNVFYRDTRFVVQFLTSVLFFLTPIFYPIEYVPKVFRWIIELNPLFVFIAPFRKCIYDFSVFGFGILFLKSILYAAFFLILSYWYWERKKNVFYHKL